MPSFRNNIVGHRQASTCAWLMFDARGAPDWNCLRMLSIVPAEDVPHSVGQLVVLSLVLVTVIIINCCW